MKRISRYIFILISFFFSCCLVIDVRALTPKTLYDIVAQDAVLDNKKSEFVANSSGIDFRDGSSDVNGKGIYELASSSNKKFPIYYYRGDIDNNNVVFANFCWKIVRTTDDGGIKLAYNGKADSNGVCKSPNDLIIANSKYNNESDAISDIGYMYGERYPSKAQYLKGTKNYVYGNDVTYSNGSYKLKDTFTSDLWDNDYETVKNKYHYTCFSNNDTCEKVYYINYVWDSDGVQFMTLSDGKKIEDLLKESATESSNENDSVIKKVIDEWYQANLVDYTLQLEDSKWCNDRSIGLYGIFDKEYNSSDYLSFNSRLRLQNAKLSLECNKNDSFTVHNTSGNQKLTYPIGLLTSDELKYAGAYVGGVSYYLNNNLEYWLNSPYTYTNLVANITFVSSNGAVAAQRVSKESGVRPAIVLKSDIKIAEGTGEAENPYVVADYYKLTINSPEEFNRYFESYNGKTYAHLEVVHLDSIKIGEIINGYKFLGYESNDVKVSTDGTFTMPDKDVELTAKFAKTEDNETTEGGSKADGDLGNNVSSTDNPNTYDSVIRYVFIGMFSLVLVIVICFYLRKKKIKNNFMI